MGSRGAFVDVNLGYFHFKTDENGDEIHEYYSLGILSSNPNVKVIMQKEGSVSAPEYSHTPGRIYATVQNGKLKHLSFYDENHKQSVSIDFEHPHHGVKPHVHYGINDHDPNTPGRKPTKAQLDLANKIKKEFNLK